MDDFFNFIKNAINSIDFSKIIHFFSQPWIKEGIQAIVNMFGKFNLWLKDQMGYSFVELLKLSGQATIWALEKVISLLKGIVK